MLRRLVCTGVLVFGYSFLAHTQSPTDGRVVKSAYENTYFHFLYSWPQFLQPYDMNSLQFAKKPESGNEFLLFSARQGDEPYGIVMVAERMNVPTQHSSGLKSSSDLMDRIARFRPEQHVVIQSRKNFTNANGFVFDELDYTEDGAPSSAIVLQIKNFLVVAKCNAKSAKDLDEMNKSVTAIRIMK